MRGKRGRTLNGARGVRNIPAYAGKTTLTTPAFERFAEHPRVCGENHRVAPQSRRPIGTSPRMRGKPTTIDNENASLGNIPAYAGKTRLRTRKSVGNTEHPRVCGKTWGSSAPGGAPEEHPRVCGENERATRPQHPERGTSPRMRGKPEVGASPNLDQRNIPAYAGKTPPPSGLPGNHPEHPRVCGENNIDRGRRYFPSRNIPAYAGKTCGQKPWARLPREHPRVCGENQGDYRVSMGRDGTSPRMRGKRVGGFWVRNHHRNIPAYAGKTTTTASRCF